MIITRLFQALILVPLLAQAQISIPTVTIGNPSNKADSTGYGTVNYIYGIGTYDVTLSEYTALLNAVAKSDPYSLYDSNLQTDLNIAGISRAGTDGSYTYSVIGDGSRPVTYVGWFDAARFANWLHNGQPTGAEDSTTTEAGPYTLNGAMDGIFIVRNSGAKWWIPNEDEWYKAAYYDPTLNGGAGGYWAYPTRSNSQPGNLIGSSPNQANYYNRAYSVTQDATYVSSQNYLTPVGAFSGSASAYGTYDQGGNVYQWNDSVIGCCYRCLRGGQWEWVATPLASSYRAIGGPAVGYRGVGFRVTTLAHIAFNIQSVSQDQNDLVIEFRTAPNATVQVQAKSSLVDIDWANVTSATAAADGAVQIRDTNNGAQASRFYRASYLTP